MVVTANYGNYDALRSLPPGVRGICFGDSAASVVKTGWLKVVVRSDETPRRSARSAKTQVLEVVAEELVLWHDAQFSLGSDPRDWVRGMLSSDDVAVFRHPATRTCAYVEADTCIVQRRGDPRQIRAQVERYRQEGFPENFGLYATGILLRRKTTATLELGRLWWEEIKRGSDRDQISFPYVLWKLGIKPRVIEGNVYQHRVVRWHGHKK